MRNARHDKLNNDNFFLLYALKSNLKTTMKENKKIKLHIKGKISIYGA